MFYEIVTINGVKTKVPLTSQLNSTMPIGFLMANDQDIKPVNCLKCDGSTFDQNKYPGLYTYLGTNVLPTLFDHSRPSDFQTLITRGTTVRPFTAEYDADITIELGSSENRYITVNGENYEQTSTQSTNSIALAVKKGDIVSCTGSSSITQWAVYGVYYSHPMFIKAVDGVDITDESAIFEEINRHNSYSTEEVATGATWIDGKPIYRKVITGLTFGAATNDWTNSGAILSNCDTLINGIALRSSDNATIKNIVFRIVNSNIQFFTNLSFTNCDEMILEYTKTTD